MHETKFSNVKGYIDEKKNINEKELFLKGWCFHEKFLDTEIRLKYSINDFNTEIYSYNSDKNKERKDVANFYNNLNIISCGWEFLLVKNSELDKIKDIEIQMFFDNKWNTIFTFDNEKTNYLSTPIKPREFIPSFVVVDNFYKNPDQVRSFALKQNFSFHPDYHKGKRTDTVYRFNGLKENFESILGFKIKNWENYGVNGCFQYCIAGDQLVYHYDNQEYAGVLFLTPDAPPNTGTSFYRSKYTKKIKVEQNDIPIIFKNGFLDSTEFDVVDVVGNVYNRLVLFDAQMIHAASTYFGNSIENGRLFQLFFFDLDV
jgi:hypothetical protein